MLKLMGKLRHSEHPVKSNKKHWKTQRLVMDVNSRICKLPRVANVAATLLMDVLPPDGDRVLDLRKIFGHAQVFFGPCRIFAEGLPPTVSNVSSDDLGVVSLFCLDCVLGEHDYDDLAPEFL